MDGTDDQLKDEGERPPAGGHGDRLVGLGISLVSLAVLGLAAWLRPAGFGAAGVGTHTQLGLPPCAFLEATGMPCATCGMTTATSLAAHGRLLAAGLTQPAGLVFALGLGVAAWFGAWLALSGRRAGPVLAGVGRVLFSGRSILIALVLVGGSWAYKAVQMSLPQAGVTMHTPSVPTPPIGTRSHE